MHTQLDDDLLDHVAEGSPPLVLPVGLHMHLATQPQHAGPAVSTWSAINNFGAIWAIYPFTFEDFDQALHHRARCTLMSETFVALMRIAIESCSPSGRQCRVRLITAKRQRAKRH